MDRAFVCHCFDLIDDAPLDNARSTADHHELEMLLGADKTRHLRVLKAVGLVEEAHPEFDARVRVYTLRPAPMADLKAWLETTERLWSEQLLAFKAHLEAGS